MDSASTDWRGSIPLFSALLYKRKKPKHFLAPLSLPIFLSYWFLEFERDMSTSLLGKLEIDEEIKAPADKFHEVFSFRPHHISNVSPDKVQGVDLHEGEWGNAGAVICWNYVHDGKNSVTKEIIDAIDDKNMSTTFKVIAGDLLTEYKAFRFIVQATPKGSGSTVHWTLEYEKMNENVPEPKTMLEFVVNVTKDIDVHLCQA